MTKVSGSVQAAVLGLALFTGWTARGMIESEGRTLSAQEEREDFGAFLIRFSNSRTYADLHTKWPIQLISVDSSGREEVSEVSALDSSDFSVEVLPQQLMSRVYSSFALTVAETDERVLEWIQTSSTVHTQLYFERIGGEWYLTRVRDDTW